jgi:hypothetical protein
MNDNTLFQEVDEDMARQRFEALWQRYGVWVVTVALILVVATGGWTFWHTKQIEKNETLTASLLALTEDAQADTAKQIATLQNFADANKGSTQAALAQLRVADLLMHQGQKDKAIALYDSMAADSHVRYEYQQLAAFLALQAVMDTAAPADLDKRLTPLLDSRSPWRLSALEDQAVLALRAGDKDKARKALAEIKQTPQVPVSLATRATDLLRFIGE